MKSERLQSDQQQEQDIKFLTKKKKSYYNMKQANVTKCERPKEKKVAADENRVTKNLQASSLFLCMTIIICIRIQAMLVFVDSLESYQSLVADLHELKSEFLFALFVSLNKKNFKGKELISCHVSLPLL